MTRGLWTRETIGWVLAIGLLPVVAVLTVEQRSTAIVGLTLATLTGFTWQLVFRLSSGVPFSPTPAVTAVALMVMGPEGMAAWHILLAVSFGLVIAESLFGGWGRNVIAAPVAALAFLYLSFPALAAPEPATTTLIAAALSGALLLVTGIASWRVFVAAIAAYLAVLRLAGVDLTVIWTSGAFAFGLVFLAGDPVAAASTQAGRWLYGALAGGLTALLAWAGPTGLLSPQPVVFAALLAQIFAPLLDHAAISAQLWTRARTHG